MLLFSSLLKGPSINYVVLVNKFRAVARSKKVVETTVKNTQGRHTECQKIKFFSKNRNSDYKTKNRRTCIKHKKMLGISAKFYVLYMFSSFLFYSHNLIRHQKKQATLCNKMNFWGTGDFRGPIWML